MLQFNGNVQIETHDALKVKTESLQYNQETKIAETSAPVTFERENVSGQSTGALVDNEKKRWSCATQSRSPSPRKHSRIRMPKNVQTLKGARAKPVNIHSAQAVFEQVHHAADFLRRRDR